MTQMLDLRAGRTGRRPSLVVPTPEEIADAAAVIQRAREARTLARRRARIEARRLAGMPLRDFRQAAYLCSWCGLGFEARVLNRPVIGRYCSQSCRQSAYQNRKRIAAKRAEKAAADA